MALSAPSGASPEGTPSFTGFALCQAVSRRGWLKGEKLPRTGRGFVRVRFMVRSSLECRMAAWGVRGGTPFLLRCVPNGPGKTIDSNQPRVYFWHGCLFGQTGARHRRHLSDPGSATSSRLEVEGPTEAAERRQGDKEALVDISLVVGLCWQSACLEAGAARAEFIEPEHFLVAMTKLGQLRADVVMEAAARKGVDASVFGPEMEMVAGALKRAGIDPGSFRHELRKRLGQGTHEFAKGEAIHRSDRSRKMFERATAVARETGATELKTGHLFLAILEEKESVGCRLLQEKGANLESLAAHDHTVVLPPKAKAEEATGTPLPGAPWP
jgi:hypothetical protein